MGRKDKKNKKAGNVPGEGNFSSRFDQKPLIGDLLRRGDALGQEGSMLEQLLQGNEGRPVRSAEAFKKLSPAADPYKDLPEIPDITLPERRSRVLLNNMLSDEMPRMIGSWLVIEQILEGSGEVDAAVDLLRTRLEKGENTQITYPDAWTLGTGPVKKLLHAARKDDGGAALEQELATIYAQCKFCDTWDAPENERYTNFIEVLAPVVTAVARSPEDIALAEKFANQQYSQDDLDMIKRVRDAVMADKKVGDDDLRQFARGADLMMSFHPVNDDLRAQFRPIVLKMMEGEKLDAAEKESFSAIISGVMKAPALTREEEARMEKNENIPAFTALVAQVGFARFGALMMAANLLQGRYNSNGSYTAGAFDEFTKYDMARENKTASNVELAEMHRESLGAFEKSLSYLEEVKKKFGSSADLIEDVPQPDVAVLKEAHRQILEKMPEKSDNRPPLYWLTKAFTKTNAKLPKELKERSAAMANILSAIPGKRNRSLGTYRDMFDETMQGFCDMLEEKQRTGEPYDALDPRHQDLIFALQEFRASLQRDIHTTGVGVGKALAHEREEHGNNQPYSEFLDAVEKTAQSLNETLRVKDEAVGKAVDSLVSISMRRHKEGVTVDDVKALQAAGQSTDHCYEVRQEPIDGMARAAIAADRILDHAQGVVDEMKKRQEILDRYAEAEKASKRGTAGGMPGGQF